MKCREVTTSEKWYIPIRHQPFASFLLPFHFVIQMFAVFDIRINDSGAYPCNVKYSNNVVFFCFLLSYTLCVCRWDWNSSLFSCQWISNEQTKRIWHPLFRFLLSLLLTAHTLMQSNSNQRMVHTIKDFVLIKKSIHDLWVALMGGIANNRAAEEMLINFNNWLNRKSEHQHEWYGVWMSGGGTQGGFAKRAKDLR